MTKSTTPKTDAVAIDARLRTLEADTGENLNRLAQSIIDVQAQIDPLKTSDEATKRHIEKLQNAVADQVVQIAQLSDRLDNIAAPKPSLWQRFQKELARRFGKET